MHLHILGIGGTFMSALAILAKHAGFKVTGCDINCYPPVTTLLQEQGIEWIEGFDVNPQAIKADCVLVGNAIKRGLPVLEAILDKGKNYTSGPQWLAENLLTRYRVMAVSGTHGKTTTASMLAFILHKAGLEPSFLIGGVATNFNSSAALSTGSWFVIEADEYDSAFFDKRPKLMHYRPEVAILTNLEFDHADIYSDLAAIEQQFHFYLRTLPNKAMIIKPRDSQSLNSVIERGFFSERSDFALDGDALWRAQLLDESGTAFRVWHKGKPVTDVNWSLIGQFNVENALAAIAASSVAGVSPDLAAQALADFKPVKRRLEIISSKHGVTIFDDFAHHPTAIEKTVNALKQSQKHTRIFAVIEFASYTMSTGIHASKVAKALSAADGAYILSPKRFSADDLHSQNWTCPYQILPSTDEIIKALLNIIKPGDAILIMSNRSFENIHTRLADSIPCQNRALA